MSDDFVVMQSAYFLFCVCVGDGGELSDAPFLSVHYSTLEFVRKK